MQDLLTLTLGELLQHTSETVRRNAMSILKTLQRIPSRPDNTCTRCWYNHRLTLIPEGRVMATCDKCLNDIANTKDIVT